MRPASTWVWGASGKHPVVKDYIMIGQDTPLLHALSRWVEEGFGRVGASPELHSWRFFARTGGVDDLSCGLVRDSRDSAGRPFPMLVVGTGRLPGWDRSWELLPVAFDALWGRIEFLCAKRAYDLAELKGDIGALPGPATAGDSHDAPGPGGGAGSELKAGDMWSVALTGGDDHLEETVRLLAGIRANSRVTPEAVFIGGTPGRSFLVAFGRALSSDDFVSLWTMERHHA